MDEITLVLANVEHKLKKLIARNGQLRQQMSGLEKANEQLQDDNRFISDENARLRNELIAVKSAKTLGGNDTSMAKQKINELLREIEKSTVLLNR